MKRITLICAISMAGVAYGVADVPTASVVARLGRGEKPVKEKGVYVMPGQSGPYDGKSEGLHVPVRKPMRVEAASSVFVLDSLVGRQESGEYTVKEAYVYDSDGNSKEARYYTWDIASSSWDMNRQVVKEWDEEGHCISEETRDYSPWGDTGSRNVMTYDASGMNIQTDMFMLEEGEWKPSQRSFYKYDTYGYMCEELIQIPSDSDGGWENFSKTIAEWTSGGLRTLAEAYGWTGSGWEPVDGRLLYEFDADGRMTSFVNDVWTEGRWVHFLRVLQEWNSYGLSRQTYEYWNDDNGDWLGSPFMPSLYAELSYDAEGRRVRETGYFYDFDIEDWVEGNCTESEYTSLENGVTRELRSTYNVEAGNILVDELVREYNSAGSDTYWKERVRESLTSPLLPLEEKFFTYDESGLRVISAEEYLFMGETRVAAVRQEHKYGQDGYPEESWYQQGAFMQTGEGDPEEWKEYSYFRYEFENGEELSRMAWLWHDGEYVSYWGESTDFNFSVPSSQCIYWNRAQMKSAYQIVGQRIYRPEGKDWTFEEGTWHYSELQPTGISEVGHEAFRVYPNPAVDFINIDGADGRVRIFGLDGREVLSASGSIVDVSSLPQGLYIVNVDGHSVKLVKR